MNAVVSKLLLLFVFSRCMMAVYTVRLVQYRQAQMIKIRRQYKNPFWLVQARVERANAIHALPQEEKKQKFKNEILVLAKNFSCRMT